MTEKIAQFLSQTQPATPCLVVDLAKIGQNYQALRRLLPLAQIFYAVKANPAPQILSMLNALGSSFDTASIGEIDLAIAQGAPAARISFGNTIKKERDIAHAYGRGIRLFAFDSDAELEKLARSAPGARVYCRILMECQGAQWPLSRKFGCSPEMAAELLIKARDLGLDAYGVSFHVGSQQTDLAQWSIAVGRAADLFAALQKADIGLRMINIGGGFPASYRHDIEPVEHYADAVMRAITDHFGNDIPHIITEPGRSLVGDAGVIQSEVVLIATKDARDPERWVYLDIGKFGGLAETMDEAIQYRITTPYPDAPTGPVVLAGPTCDSADILYEKSGYRLPLALKVGDKVEILSAGAYTSSYCSVNFNGFSPLETHCI